MYLLYVNISRIYGEIRQKFITSQSPFVADAAAASCRAVPDRDGSGTCQSLPAKNGDLTIKTNGI